MMHKEPEIGGRSESAAGVALAAPGRLSRFFRILGKLMVRILVIVAVLLLGIGMMLKLGSMKEPPRQAEANEPKIQVEVLEVSPEDVPVVITGYGEARSLNVVAITPEVMGKVVAIHPRLEEGELIPKGELLFRIDPRDYEAAKDQAQAQVDQARNMVERLTKQFRIDIERLETLRRSRELAEMEYRRVKELLEKDDVGTQSGVDRAEMAFNQANDAFDLLDQAIELYPIRIREAESGLAAAKAALQRAATSLERTELRVDFNARVRQVQLEVGQYVAPGAAVLTLADDSVLEISVPLDSRDARRWLRFAANHPPTGKTGTDPSERVPERDGSVPVLAWFPPLEPAPCRICWTEDPNAYAWQGTLNRVERFDKTTRTVTVAVRVASADALSSEAGLPLVDGMFCSIEIPGSSMEQVYRLPRWAVSFEGQVYLSVDHRLKKREVQVVRNQGEETFVSQGLAPGDLVVVTRLVNPLPNSLLEHVAPIEGEGPANADAEQGVLVLGNTS